MLHRQRWFTLVTSFDLVTSDDPRSVKWSKTANQWFRHSNFTAWLAVTPAKLRKLTLQTNLQIWPNNFTLTWSVTSEMTWSSTKLVFSSMNFPGLSIAVFAFPIRCVVSELGGKGAQNDPPATDGWRGGPAAAGLKGLSHFNINFELR